VLGAEGVGRVLTPELTPLERQSLIASGETLLKAYAAL
jgi:hypothetical protein